MAKQGLRKTWNLKAKLVSNFGGAQKHMGEGDEKRKKKKKEGSSPKRYGTTNLEYGSLVLFG